MSVWRWDIRTQAILPRFSRKRKKFPQPNTARDLRGLKFDESYSLREGSDRLCFWGISHQERVKLSGTVLPIELEAYQTERISYGSAASTIYVEPNR